MSNSDGLKERDIMETSSQQIPINSQTSAPSDKLINDRNKEFLAELSKQNPQGKTISTLSRSRGTFPKTRPDNIEVPKIQKVPKMLLQNPDLKKYYEPTVMIVGPLHRPCPQIASEHEPLKWNLASKFVRDSGKTGDDLLGEIKQHVDDLKRWFNKDDIRDYDDDTFAQMLFLDGCAVLQFISSFVSTNLKEVKINTGQAVLIQQDLLLLENQIPYRVLRLLIKKLPEKNAELMRQRVEEFILLSLMVPHTQFDWRLVDRYSQFFKKIGGDGSANQPAHLLDFLHLAILLDDKEREEADEMALGRTEKEIEEADEMASRRTEKEREEADEMGSGRTEKEREEAVIEIQEGAKAAESKRTQMFAVFAGIKDKYFDVLYSHPSRSFSRWSFRNVQDLRASGIRLRPSNSPSLTKVKFSSKFFFWGQLRLPALVVDDSTSRKLLNLVAFEMCPDNYKNDFRITSYLSFLDSLIDIDQDVKDLRIANILRNHLSSDSDVTQLFNTIGSNLIPDDTFVKVKNKIQNYYERRSAWWVAQICRDHFKNPWTILALLAGMIALFLTAVQTWFAAFPNQ